MHVVAWAEALDVPRLSGASGGPDAALIKMVRCAAGGVVDGAPASEGRASVLFAGRDMRVVGLLLSKQQLPHAVVLLAVSPEARGRGLAMWCYMSTM